MNIRTKYDVGDIVMYVEDVTNKNTFSIRGLLPVLRVKIEVTLPKAAKKSSDEKNINIQYGFKTSKSATSYKWINEKFIFVNFQEADDLLKSLGYKLNVDKNTVLEQNGFQFLTIDNEDKDNEYNDIPF